MCCERTSFFFSFRRCTLFTKPGCTSQKMCRLNEAFSLTWNLAPSKCLENLLFKVNWIWNFERHKSGTPRNCGVWKAAWPTVSCNGKAPPCTSCSNGAEDTGSLASWEALQTKGNASYCQHVKSCSHQHTNLLFVLVPYVLPIWIVLDLLQGNKIWWIDLAADLRSRYCCARSQQKPKLNMPGFQCCAPLITVLNESCSLFHIFSTTSIY